MDDLESMTASRYTDLFSQAGQTFGVSPVPVGSALAARPVAWADGDGANDDEDAVTTAGASAVYRFYRF